MNQFIELPAWVGYTLHRKTEQTEGKHTEAPRSLSRREWPSTAYKALCLSNGDSSANLKARKGDPEP